MLYFPQISQVETLRQDAQQLFTQDFPCARFVRSTGWSAVRQMASKQGHEHSMKCQGALGWVGTGNAGGGESGRCFEVGS